MAKVFSTLTEKYRIETAGEMWPHTTKKNGNEYCYSFAVAINALQILVLRMKLPVWPNNLWVMEYIICLFRNELDTIWTSWIRDSPISFEFIKLIKSILMYSQKYINISLNASKNCCLFFPKNNKQISFVIIFVRALHDHMNIFIFVLSSSSSLNHQLCEVLNM